VGACSDYEEEVRCADRVTYRQCGDRTARLVARVTRQLLKISQDTTNCYGRLVSAASRSRSGDCETVGIPPLMSRKTLGILDGGSGLVPSIARGGVGVLQAWIRAEHNILDC